MKATFDELFGLPDAPSDEMVRALPARTIATGWLASAEHFTLEVPR